MKRSLLQTVRNQKLLLLFLVPGLIAVIVFNYFPMVGILMAFEDYQPKLGFFGSPLAGLTHFETFLTDAKFYRAVRNTLAISILYLLFGFPAPIILALMIDSVNRNSFKRVTQTITYLPHFVSWVVVASLVYRLLDLEYGAVNKLIELIGIEPRPFFRQPQSFWAILTTTWILKEVGWGSIIYLAAISAIDPEQHSAAMIDGAGEFRRLLHITLPGITPTIILMLILSLGTLVKVNFDAAFNLQNALILETAEVIDTYVYRTGVRLGRYSYAAAIGFVQSVISFALVYGGIRLSRRYSDYAII